MLSGDSLAIPPPPPMPGVTAAAAAAAALGSTSPKLSSYRGTAEQCQFEGETVRHYNAGKLAKFELKAPGHKREDIEINIISKFK